MGNLVHCTKRNKKMVTKNKEAKINAAIAQEEAKINATTVARQTNSAQVSAIGKNAVVRWTEGDKQTKAGDACGIYAILAAQYTMTFDAVVERKKEETSEAISFDVLDLLDDSKWIAADGKNDRVKKSAAMEAVLGTLFGITDASNAQKQAIFQRCLPTAGYVVKALALKSFEELSELVTLETVNDIEMLSLPRFLVNEEPGEDASKNEKALYEATKNVPVQLDGSTGNSVATLRERAKPKRQPKAPVAAVDKGTSLLGSIKQVATVVAEWNNADATTDLAPNEEMRQQLFALAQTIAAYFSADPLDVETSVAA